MFKKITKLSCSFFCNFDCFHMREPSGFLMLLLLLLLLFFEPRRFLFQILIGKLSPGLFSQGPILYFQPNFPIISGYYAFFSLLQGRGRSPNRHLTQPTFDTNRHLTQCFCGTDWGETAPSRSKFMLAHMNLPLQAELTSCVPQI